MKSSSLAAEGAAAKDRNPVREDLVSFGVLVKYGGVPESLGVGIPLCRAKGVPCKKNGSCQNHCIVCTAPQVLHMFAEWMRHKLLSMLTSQ